MTVIEPLTEPTIVGIAGDWHGNTPYATKAIDYAAKFGADTILHLGDFGYRFHPTYLAAVDEHLARHDMRLLFVDGNHEDHQYLASLPRDSHGLRPVSRRVWHLPRGFRWEWHGIRFLALGGAHSVDRQRLTPGASWWPGERITAADALAVAAAGRADVMLCHDCPAGVDVPGLDPSSYPADDIRSADQHRALLRSVVDTVAPRRLWHGHYHVRYSAELAIRDQWCRVDGLGCDEAPLVDNVHLVHLPALAEQLSIATPSGSV